MQSRDVEWESQNQQQRVGKLSIGWTNKIVKACLEIMVMVYQSGRKRWKVLGHDISSL